MHEACLALQKHYALDINLLFFCCWFGWAGGGRLEPSQLESAMVAVEGWQEDIVRPIWQSRWLLKPSYKSFPTLRTEPLRRALIEAELLAEHIEQLHLVESMPFRQNKHLDEDIRAANAVANIFLYLKAFAGKKSGMTLEKDDVMEPVLTLVAACFSGQNKEMLKSLIEDPQHSV